MIYNSPVGYKNMKQDNRDTFQKISEAPAAALDNAVATSLSIKDKIPTGNVVKHTRAYWHKLGPGLTTGASDDDPSGIATYSQAGAQYGFGLLWMASFTFPLMAVVQEMCARIGLVTGRGLAGNIRAHYPRKVIFICTALLFAANSFNIGADLGAMAKGAQLLAPGVNYAALVVAFAGLSLGMQIFTPYEKYAKYLKWLAMVLVAYIFSAIMAHLNWSEVLRSSLVPHIKLDRDQILLVCAILGTTISPYLFFWQTSQEVENQIAEGNTTIVQRQGTTKEAVKNMRIDVWSGMFLSNIVMFFIIAACGAILFPNGITNITSAAQAAEGLRPFAGDATYWLFAVGIIGTGLLAIPVLAGASSYAIAESMQWRKQGLNNKLNQAHAFYGIIIISMLIGLGLNFIGLDPIKALIYSAIGNGLVAPIILFLIVRISSNKKVMGDWTNKPLTTALGWAITLIMAVAGIAAIVSFF